MNWSLILAGLSMGLTMGGAGLASAWWIVRSIWQLDVRLSRVETALKLTPAPGTSRPRVLRGGRDYGSL